MSDDKKENIFVCVCAHLAQILSVRFSHYAQKVCRKEEKNEIYKKF